MSKGGGAGKVYFVLYLAVVLELLIIIVERDEAEESLHKKQRETMRIVESILSQLQSGAGTEGINTRPQDEITIPPPNVNIKEVMGSDIKSFRRYVVEVGVTDISAELKRKEGESEVEYAKRIKKLIELGNVEELEYQIFYNSSQEAANAPDFPSEDELRKLKKEDLSKLNVNDPVPGTENNPWILLSVRKLKLDKDATFNRLDLRNLTLESIQPVYPPFAPEDTKGESYAPKDSTVFAYSPEETNKKSGISTVEGALKKRAFIVNFQPPNKAGWYKLRFVSRTNRILGVRADVDPTALDDETTVNIGTVQLTVKDLRKVQKELISKLEEFTLPPEDFLEKEKDVDKFDEMLAKALEQATGREDSEEMRSKIRLYGYIAKLLAPGQSINFAQNRGSIEFNVRVITPQPTVAEPTIALPPGDIATFDAIPVKFELTISPYQGTGNVIEGRILDGSTPISRLIFYPMDENPIFNRVKPPIGGKRDYLARTDAPLKPGKYTIEITHRVSGKSKTETKDLYVFKTGLEEKSETMLSQYLEFYSSYGNYLILNPIPTSGGKIKSDQFRIQFIATGANQYSKNIVVRGLNVTRDDNFYLEANASNLSLKIYWEEPYEKEQVVLFEKSGITIKQKKPTINIVQANEMPPSGTEKRIKLRVRNIRIVKPEIGGEGEAVVKVWVDKLAKINVNGYSASEPQLIDDKDGTYSIEVELTGSLPKDETKVRGSVEVTIYAEATNPINGKSSGPESKVYTFRLNYEPEKEQAPDKRQQRRR